MTKKITSPEEFFGHQLGADRKIARWDKIVEYFTRLQKESKRIKVVDMGPSTEGHPFLMVLITSEANMKDLDKLQDINITLTNPGELTEDEARLLVEAGKAVVIQSMSRGSQPRAGIG